MGTGLRVAVAVVVVLVVAVGAGVLYLLSSLDAIVARQIEIHGTRLAGAAVDVDGVDIELGSGTGTIRGLRIANPEGFSDATAISLEDITIQIDVGSLRSGPVRVPRIEVGRTDVLFEADARGRSNIGTLRDNVQGEPAAPAEPEAGEPRRLRIDRLAFDGGRIETRVAGTERGDREVKLPGLSLSNLGGSQGGTPGEIGKQALLELTRRIVVAVAKSEVRGVVEEQVDGLLDRIFE